MENNVKKDKLMEKLDRYLLSNEAQLSEEDVEFFDSLWNDEYDQEQLDEMTKTAAAGYTAVAAVGSAAGLVGAAAGVGIMFAARKYLASCMKKCSKADDKTKCKEKCRADAKKKREDAKKKAKK